MSQQCFSPDEAILAAILNIGPLQLQRKLQKRRLARPELDHCTHVTNLTRDIRPNQLSSSFQLPAGSTWLSCLDRAFPRMLLPLVDPPSGLFYRGCLQNLHRPAVSIVGSRACTNYGLQVTRALAGELARLGFVIVSGLALGIDAAAHEAALAVGGRTLAVLGSGVDRIYPRAHHHLAERILDQAGTLISEMPPGAPPKAFHFPIRNRIISGLSHATIVVEAEQRSGSLSTARHCLDQGRELFAVPGPIHRSASCGTNQLIASGQTRLLDSVESLLNELQPLIGLASSHFFEKQRTIKDSIARKIYDSLDAFEPLGLEELLAEHQEPPSKLLATLSILEAQDWVLRRPGPVFLRNPLQTTT